jgi:hypothetical protein
LVIGTSSLCFLRAPEPVGVNAAADQVQIWRADDGLE